MKRTPKLEELLELEDFRKRTAMYIGKKKISILNAFIDGVFYSFDAYNVDEGWIFDGFHDWVADYYNWTESTAGWKNIILKECSGDEEKSIDEFFKLYDKFKNQKSS